MAKKTIFAVSGFLIFALSVSLINAHATPFQVIPFEGNAWVAHHIEYGNYTNDYFFVIDPKGLDIDPKSVTLNGFTIKQSTENLNFFELTKVKNLLWFEIEKFKGKKNITSNLQTPIRINITEKLS